MPRTSNVADDAKSESTSEPKPTRRKTTTAKTTRSKTASSSAEGKPAGETPVKRPVGRPPKSASAPASNGGEGAASKPSTGGSGGGSGSGSGEQPLFGADRGSDRGSDRAVGDRPAERNGDRPYGPSSGGPGMRPERPERSERPERPDRPYGPGGGGGYGPRPYGPGGGQGGPGGPGGFQGMGGGMGNRRRKKKKRGFGPMGGGMGGGGGWNNGGGGAMDFSLPSDEELEREAAELEKAAAHAPADDGSALSISELQRMDIEELHTLAEKEGLENFHKLPKQDLIFKLLKTRAAKQGLMFGEGTLEIMPDQFGFLRSPEQSYLAGPDDIYVSPTFIKRFGLRKGMVVKGVIRPPKEAERYFALLRVDEVNGKTPSTIGKLSNFEDLTPLHPEKRFILETTPNEIEMRIVDLVSPIGFGQRALIVAPPRTGKTVIMQKMTKAINKNYPEAFIIVLLVDERPEEVTDFRRNCGNSHVEVVASTFDEQSGRHVAIAEMVIEKAKRMVEFGYDVVILLDSITRLARAYNAEMPHSGKIMTGGIDAGALQRPKKFFGAARAIEHGGSLTIIGTALVDTGSKADEVIFEEFKGTGNSELHLDRRLVEKRIWPAIDVAASGTRREELLMDRRELELVHRLRKVLSDMNVVEAMELLKSRLSKVKTNAEFLMTMNIG